jgi:hypothetical protein
MAQLHTFTFSNKSIKVKVTKVKPKATNKAKKNRP